ncbi:hypothetical protein ABZ835_46880 [Streptomyces sp. NPDC047461]|uniref:hypothetical protein n=1 Tax=Streptomyces sp. NPDC047461 TaxID=3155619 RepID=UPI0033F6036B
MTRLDARNRPRTDGVSEDALGHVADHRVIAQQRLIGLIGINSLELGVMPFSASLPTLPGNGFWI